MQSGSISCWKWAVTDQRCTICTCVCSPEITGRTAVEEWRTKWGGMWGQRLIAVNRHRYQECIDQCLCVCECAGGTRHSICCGDVIDAMDWHIDVLSQPIRAQNEWQHVNTGTVKMSRMHFTYLWFEGLCTPFICLHALLGTSDPFISHLSPINNNPVCVCTGSSQCLEALYTRSVEAVPQNVLATAVSSRLHFSNSSVKKSLYLITCRNPLNV